MTTFRFAVRSLVLYGTLLVLCAADTAWVHPSAAMRPNATVGQVSGGGGYPPHSINKIQFTGEALPRELSAAELYMLSGCRSADGSDGLLDWQSTITGIAARYYRREGRLPEAITPEVAARAFDCDVSTLGRLLDEIRSPITGDFPRLDAYDFTPGGVYLHVLTLEEMQHFARLNPDYEATWFKGYSLSADGSVATPVEFEGPVLYLRLHGEKATLRNTLVYSCRVAVEHSAGSPVQVGGESG